MQNYRCNNLQYIFTKKIFQFSKKGTAQYLSPEIIITHKFDYEADVWALGIIIYEILTNGISPFNYENNNKIYDEIKNYSDFKSISEPIKKLHVDEDLVENGFNPVLTQLLKIPKGLAYIGVLTFSNNFFI